MKYILTFLLLFTPLLTSAQESYVDIGNGNKYLCIVTDSENYLGKLFFDDMFFEVRFYKHINRRERKLNRITKRLNRFLANDGPANKIKKLQRKLRKLEALLNDMYACLFQEGKYASDGDYNPPSNPPTDPDDGETPNTLACDVAGGSTRSFNVQQSDFPTSRIINGNVCSVGDSPVVELVMYDNRGEAGGCTGTVVAKRVVITAAHCVEGGITKVDIVTGNGTLSTRNIHAHSGFDRPGAPLEANDVAVLVTNQDIPTRTVSMLRNDDMAIGEFGVIAGYGLDENGNYGTLRAAPLNLARKTTASITIEYSGHGDNGNTCSGDSGGPLFITRNNQWVLAGVTSNGILNNCGPGDVSNFANVTDPSNLSFFDSIF